MAKRKQPVVVRDSWDDDDDDDEEEEHQQHQGQDAQKIWHDAYALLLYLAFRCS